MTSYTSHTLVFSYPSRWPLTLISYSYNKIMERRIHSSLVKLICFVLFTSWLIVINVAASSRTNNKFNYYSELLRRNLLANGLGMTPPMGYATFLLYIFASQQLSYLFCFLLLADVSLNWLWLVIIRSED